MSSKKKSTVTSTTDNDESSNNTITRKLDLKVDNIEQIKQFLGDQIEFDKSEGTPQKRIFFLFKQCEYLFYNNLKYNQVKFNQQFNNKTLKYNSFINELSKVSRDGLPGLISSNSELITKFIGTLLSEVKKIQLLPDKVGVYISLWISILVKSISDISLCGSLLNLIPEIYGKIGNEKNLKTLDEINTIKDSKNLIQKHEKVKNILEGNINLAFFSSDTITSALSSNIVKLMPYPIQILYSTKRSGVSTQTIIIQKNIISTLSIILSYIGDIDKIADLQRKIPTNNTNYSNIVDVLVKINKFVLLFFENLRPQFLDVTVIQDHIQKVFDDLFLYQNTQKINSDHDNNIIQLYSLIYNISNISELINCLEIISKILIIHEEDYFIVNRWTYHLSNDIFKYRYPLYKELFTEKYWDNKTKTLKEEISKEEIFSATYDAMYGHDFPYDFIKDLGKEFLESINQKDKYKFDNIVKSKIEHNCIIQTLSMNNYSTLNQHGDKFSIRLNPANNYLVSDKNEMYFRLPEKPWNITLSPLFKQTLYSSVDFVSGEPAISLLLVEQVNYIKSISNKGVYVYEIANETTRQEKIKTISEEINTETNYNEIFNSCSLFDGAAPYGGKPIYFLDETTNPYITDYIIDTNNTSGNKKNKNSSNFKIQFSIITETTSTEQQLIEKWIEKRIEETQQINSNDPIDVINALTPSLINIENEYKENVIKFNEIWGSILNSSNRLSNDTKELIIDTFRKIIGNISSEVTKLKQPNKTTEQRSSRNQPVDINNYFDDNQQFNNEIIKEFISTLETNKILKNKNMFNQLMNYYAKIITEPEQPTDTTYQNNITNFLKILEICIRKTIVLNPNGIFKGLPILTDEIVLTNEGDENQQKFLKEIKKSLNSIIVKNSALMQRQTEGLIVNKTKSLPGTTEKNIQVKMGERSKNQKNPNEDTISPLHQINFSSSSVSDNDKKSDDVLMSESDDENEGVNKGKSEIDTQHDSQVPYNTPPPAPSPSKKYAKIGTDIEEKSPRGGKTLKLRIKNQRKSIKKGLRSAKNHTVKHMKNKQKHNKTP